MRVNNFVSHKVFLSSIVLLIISIIICIYAASKGEYLISVAMIFVMLLQVANIISYRQQNRNGRNARNGGDGENKQCHGGRRKF